MSSSLTATVLRARLTASENSSSDERVILSPSSSTYVSLYLLRLKRSPTRFASDDHESVALLEVKRRISVPWVILTMSVAIGLGCLRP